MLLVGVGKAGTCQVLFPAMGNPATTVAGL